MAFLEDLARQFFPLAPAGPTRPVTRARALSPDDFESQLKAIRNKTAPPWRAASIVEALGVPAIYRCVALIASTVGSLSMDAYRDGAKLDPADRPRLIVRPNPYTTAREFFRDAGYAMATRGEALWWVASRDGDGVASALYPMPPQEVVFEEHVNQPLRPTVTWRGTEVPLEDVVHIPFMREPGERRGRGPLQMCGAAISVSVEAQEWAADFFASGGLPPALIRSAVKLSEEEAQKLKEQWVETPNNVPKVVDPLIEGVQQLQWDQQAAQFTDARLYQVGDAARMFGIPGALVEYTHPGSNLTYQNVEQVFDLFVRACLLPYYLQPIEQAMSDLLTRSTVSEFNVEGLLRADIKTRFEVYESAITKSGVMNVDEARQKEGLAPGDVERAPVPPAQPTAVPDQLPYTRSAAAPVRCSSCNRLLAELAAEPYRFTCPKCKWVNESHPRLTTAAKIAS